MYFDFSEYTLVDEPEDACDYIKSSEECKAAAQYLRLSDGRLLADGKNEERPHNDPPYCYFEETTLKFNSDGTNTGLCGEKKDICLCKQGKLYYY